MERFGQLTYRDDTGVMGCIGKMEKIMETSIQGLAFGVYSLGSRNMRLNPVGGSTTFWWSL